MKRRREQVVEPEVVAFWQKRLLALRQQLDAAPTADDVWFWQIQSDIITYLLQRYAGQDVKLPSHIAKQLAESDVSSATKHIGTATQPSSSFTAAASRPNGPRSSRDMKPVLEAIAARNAERHEILRQLREEILELTRVEQEERLNALQAWRARRVRPNPPPEPEPALPAAATPPNEPPQDDPDDNEYSDGLTAKEIADIVSGKVEVEPLPDDWNPDE